MCKCEIYVHLEKRYKFYATLKATVLSLNERLDLYSQITLSS